MTCHNCCNGCASAYSCGGRCRSECYDGATPFGLVLFILAFAIFALLMGPDEQMGDEATVPSRWESTAQQ